MGHYRNSKAVSTHPGFAAALGLALEQRADPWTADCDSAHAVLAVHTLLHVLSHVLSNPQDFGACGEGSAGSSPDGQEGAQLVMLDGPDTDLVDGMTRVLVSSGADSSAASSCSGGGSSSSSRSAQVAGASIPAPAGHSQHGQKEAIYISLASAARSLGVMLPAALSVARKDGSPALAAIQAAELRFGSV